MSKVETRNVQLLAEVRAAGPGKVPNKLVGYVARFGVESQCLYDPEVGGDFVEVIAPGAFARSLRERPDVRALYNHDTSVVLGRTASGTLKLAEDDQGLAFSCELPDTQAGRDVRELVGRGDINGCSFGFTVVEDDVRRRDDGTILRTLMDVDLIEVTVCAFPAYDASSVALRDRRMRAAAARPRLARARRLLALIDLARRA